MTPLAFRSQLTWLLEQGYHFLALGDLADRISKGIGYDCEHDVVITFDDGYRDFAEHAWPILSELGIPATLFVVTGKLGQHSDWDQDHCAPLLSYDELCAISRDPLVSIGGHTHNHVRLRDLDTERLLFELRTPLEILRSLGEPFPAFSYPWGAVTDREARAVQEAGYSCAVDTEPRRYLKGIDLFRLGRITMRSGMDLPAFAEAVASRRPGTLRLATAPLLRRLRWICSLGR